MSPQHPLPVAVAEAHVLEPQRPRPDRQRLGPRPVLDHRVAVEHLADPPHARRRRLVAGAAGGELVQRVEELPDVAQEDRERPDRDRPLLHAVGPEPEDGRRDGRQDQAQHEPVEHLLAVQPQRGRDVAADAAGEPPVLVGLAVVGLHQPDRRQRPLDLRRQGRVGVPLGEVVGLEPLAEAGDRDPEQRDRRERDEREQRVERRHEPGHHDDREHVHRPAGHEVVDALEAVGVVGEAVDRVALGLGLVVAHRELLELLEERELHPRPAAVADADREVGLHPLEHLVQEPQDQQQERERDDHPDRPLPRHPVEQPVDDPRAAVRAVLGVEVDEDRQRDRRQHAGQDHHDDQRQRGHDLPEVVAEVPQRPPTHLPRRQVVPPRIVLTHPPPRREHPNPPPPATAPAGRRSPAPAPAAVPRPWPRRPPRPGRTRPASPPRR